MPGRFWCWARRRVRKFRVLARRAGRVVRLWSSGRTSIAATIMELWRLTRTLQFSDLVASQTPTIAGPMSGEQALEALRAEMTESQHTAPVLLHTVQRILASIEASSSSSDGDTGDSSSSSSTTTSDDDAGGGDVVAAMRPSRTRALAIVGGG